MGFGSQASSGFGGGGGFGQQPAAQPQQRTFGPSAQAPAASGFAPNAAQGADEAQNTPVGPPVNVAQSQFSRERVAPSVAFPDREFNKTKLTDPGIMGGYVLLRVKKIGSQNFAKKGEAAKIKDAVTTDLVVLSDTGNHRLEEDVTLSGAAVVPQIRRLVDGQEDGSVYPFIVAKVGHGENTGKGNPPVKLFDPEPEAADAVYAAAEDAATKLGW